VREPIDMTLALQQHAAYDELLRQLGVDVVSLPPEPKLPDSVFVEDAAIVLDECAIIPFMGAPSRRAETASIATALEPYRRIVKLPAQGTLDGGDVLRVGRTIYVGSSLRSTASGIETLRRALAELDYDVRATEVRGCLHLKSACTLATPETLLVNPEWVDASQFAGLRMIEVPRQEPRAANVLRVGSHVIVAACFPQTRALLAAHGLDVLTLDESELMKAEAGLTCTSILFD
jgi:dimethylargininase